MGGNTDAWDKRERTTEKVGGGKGGRVSKLRLSSPDDLAQLCPEPTNKKRFAKPNRAFLPEILKAHISRLEL